MMTMRTVSRWLLWISVALLASPGLAAAQNAVLYEVTETMKITGGGSGRRDASAALMGTVNAGTSLCPAALAKYLGVEKCSIVADGVSSIDLSTGKGPLGGKFAVVVQDNNSVDAAEFAIAKGKIKGRIDLSPAVLYNHPLGTLQGTWTAKGEQHGPLAGLRIQGTVWGVFRLPFVLGIPDGCLSDGNPDDCWHVTDPLYWFGPGPADVASVRYGELSLGVPTVRLELTFTETSREKDRGDGDDD